MARKHFKHDPYGDLHRNEEARAKAVQYWLCGRASLRCLMSECSCSIRRSPDVPRPKMSGAT